MLSDGDIPELDDVFVTQIDEERDFAKSRNRESVFFPFHPNAFQRHDLRRVRKNEDLQI